MNNFNAGYKGLPLTISVKSVYERSKYTPTENTIFRAHAALQVHYSGVLPVGFFKVKGQRYAVGVGFSDGEAVRIVLCDITPMTAKVLTMADIKNQLRKDTPRGEITKETLLAKMETGDKAMATLAIAYMLCHEAHPTHVTLDGLNDIEKHISHDLLLTYVPTYVGLLKPGVMEVNIGKFLVANEVISVIAKLKPGVEQQFDSPITDVYMENASGLRVQIFHHLSTHLPFSNKIDNLEVFGTMLLQYYHPELLHQAVLQDSDEYRFIDTQVKKSLTNLQIEGIKTEVEGESKCKVTPVAHYIWFGDKYSLFIKDTDNHAERFKCFWLYCTKTNITFCYNTLSLFNDLKIDKIAIGTAPLNKIDYISITLMSEIVSNLKNPIPDATERQAKHLNYALIKLLHCFPFMVDSNLLSFIKGEENSSTKEEVAIDKETDTLCMAYGITVCQIHAKFNSANTYQLMTDIGYNRGNSVWDKFWLLRDFLNNMMIDGGVQFIEPRPMGYGLPQQPLNNIHFNGPLSVAEVGPIVVSYCTSVLEVTEKLFSITPIATKKKWESLTDNDFIGLVETYLSKLRIMKMLLNQTNPNLR